MVQRESSLVAIALLLACFAGRVHGRPGAFSNNSSADASLAGLDEEVPLASFLQKVAGQMSTYSDIPETALTVRVRSPLTGLELFGKETDRSCSNGEKVYSCPELPCVINSCPAQYECFDILCGGCSFLCKPIQPQPFAAILSTLKSKPLPQPKTTEASRVSAPIPEQVTQQAPGQSPQPAPPQPPVNSKPAFGISVPNAILCMPGYVFSKSVNRCTMCSPGYYSSIGAACEPCPVDYYAARSASSYCNDCTGASSTWGKIAQTGCLMTPNP